MQNKTSSIETLTLQFLDAAASVERRLDHSLSHIRGISFSEYRLLSTIHRGNPKGVARVDIASQVGLTASAVTRALKPLEKLGYVITHRSERDARQSLTALTAAGVELLDDAQGVMRDALADSPLTALSENKQAEFVQRLDELRRQSS